MRRNIIKSLAASLLMAIAGSSWGSGNLESLADKIRFSGFASIVGSVSDKEADYLRFAHINDSGNFERETSLGLQLDVELSKTVGLTTQLIADDFADDFALKADWLYLNYKLSNNLKFRAGRLRVPAFNYSDSLEVGFSYPWIRPPSEVYEIIPVNGLNGIDLIWTLPMGDANLIFQPFAGSSTLTSFFGFSGENLTEAEETIGLLVKLATDNHEFTISSFKSEINMSDPDLVPRLQALFSAINPALGAAIPVLADLVDRADLNFYQLGYNGHFGNLNIIAEGARRETKDVPIIPNFDGAFLTLGYHFNDWFPHITYGSIDTRNNPPTPQQSKSVTLGLRKEMPSGTALKIDYTQMDVDTDIPNNRGLLTEIIPGEDIDKVKALSIGLEAYF